MQSVLATIYGIFSLSQVCFILSLKGLKVMHLGSECLNVALIPKTNKIHGKKMGTKSPHFLAKNYEKSCPWILKFCMQLYQQRITDADMCSNFVTSQLNLNSTSTRVGVTT
jgi:hypothetical protein